MMETYLSCYTKAESLKDTVLIIHRDAETFLSTVDIDCYEAIYAIQVNSIIMIQALFPQLLFLSLMCLFLRRGLETSTKERKCTAVRLTSFEHETRI